MTKWQIARYLIDAKKDIDSLSFIAWNVDNLNIDNKKIINLYRNDFYINCAAICDKFFIKNKSIKKKDIQQKYETIEQIYYYRDKHAGHKDDDYLPIKYNNNFEMIIEMQKQLRFIRKFCKDILPTNITLDFVSYDESLFRQLHNITKKQEELIYKRKHPGYIKMEDIDLTFGGLAKIFNDTEDYIFVDTPDNYVVTCDYGLTKEESLHNRQDACILVNVLHGTNIWCTMNYKKYKMINLAKSLGYVTIFDEFIRPNVITEKVKKDMDFIKYSISLNV